MRIPQSEIEGWSTRPGSRKLGAKWVEVIRAATVVLGDEDEGEFENVASNTR